MPSMIILLVYLQAGLTQMLRSIKEQTPALVQGCQMDCFQTKNPNLGKFWRALAWKILLYFMPIWNILRYLEYFKIFYDHLVHFVFIWYIFSGLGIMHQEKSTNPALGLHINPVPRRDSISRGRGVTKRPYSQGICSKSFPAIK
jgi:hypothetical protein